MNPATHKHDWQDSKKVLDPSSGTLYFIVYPEACTCGAVRSFNGEITLPKITRFRNILIDRPSQDEPKPSISGERT